MSKTPKKKPQTLATPSSSQTPSQGDFDVVLRLIEAVRTRAVAAVNTTLIDFYWNVGEFISSTSPRTVGERGPWNPLPRPSNAVTPA